MPIRICTLESTTTHLAYQNPQLYSCEDNVLLRVLQTAVHMALHFRLQPRRREQAASRSHRGARPRLTSMRTRTAGLAVESAHRQHTAGAQHMRAH